MLMSISSHWALICLSMLIGLKNSEPLLTLLCQAPRPPGVRGNIPHKPGWLMMQWGMMKEFTRMCVYVYVSGAWAFSQAISIKLSKSKIHSCFRHLAENELMSYRAVLFACSSLSLSSVRARPQVQQLGKCKEENNRKMDREYERFLILSCCFEVCPFEKSEWTAHADWCKNLAMSLAFQIALLSKYDERSVTKAVYI